MKNVLLIFFWQNLKIYHLTLDFSRVQVFLVQEYVSFLFIVTSIGASQSGLPVYAFGGLGFEVVLRNGRINSL